MKSLDIFCEEKIVVEPCNSFSFVCFDPKKSTKMIMGFCVFAHEKVSDNFGSISTIVLLVGQKHATKMLAAFFPAASRRSIVSVGSDQDLD